MSSLHASPVQSRQTRHQFTNREDYLSYELGQAVKALPPLYTRLLAGSISVMIFATLGWAYFSKIDEVVVAPGELIPSTQVRPIRALKASTIQSVRRKEGDPVKKGDVLVELDPTTSQTEVESLEKSRRLVLADVRRLEAESTGQTPMGNSTQDQLLRSRQQEFSAQQAAAAAEGDRQAAVIQEARARLVRLQENLTNARSTLVNAQQREAGLKILVDPQNAAIPRVDYLEAQNQRVEAQDKVVSLEQEIAAQTQVIRQAEAASQSIQSAVTRLNSERQSQILTQLKQRREDLTTLEGQLKQAQKQQQQETIISPVSGVVYNVKATKGSVQPGEELLSILPEGQELILEVKVLNRDIGFIHEGMKTKVKLATFPFQEFGTIEGIVLHVSPNATTNEKLGLVFPTRIKLTQSSVKVHGQQVKLAPGMAGNGEIVTRKKSILVSILEPVTRRFSEGL